MIPSKVWTNDTTQSTTKVPEGKDQRLIITHAGTSSGFVPNCLLVFKSAKTTEYHEEMNFEKFKVWFLILLDNLKEPDFIIMDNAPYHSVQKHKQPTSANRKLNHCMASRKRNRGQESMLKNDLLRLVGLHKPNNQTFIYDIAHEKGHTVLRLPPYHCQYNPIELIWAQVKGYAARHNTTPPFTANKKLQLLKSVVDNVSAEDWKKVVTKCRKVMEEDCERDVRFDNICEQEFIINLQDCSSDSGTDSCMDLGIL